MKTPRATRTPWLELHRYTTSLDKRPSVKFKEDSLCTSGVYFDRVYNVVPRNIFGAEEQEFLDLAEQFLVAKPDPYDLRQYDPLSRLTSHKDLKGVLAWMSPGSYISTDWFCFVTSRGNLGLSLERFDE